MLVQIDPFAAVITPFGFALYANIEGLAEEAVPPKYTLPVPAPAVGSRLDAAR